MEWIGWWLKAQMKHRHHQGFVDVPDSMYSWSQAPIIDPVSQGDQNRQVLCGRNYHTRLLSRALAGATITPGYISMVVASTVMSTAGLLLNSPAVVIGSMCVAPFMGPSRAVCIGILFHNQALVFGGLAKQLLGLLAIGSAVSGVMTYALHLWQPEMAIGSEILIRSMPSQLDVALSLLVAISAGAAASLALTAHKYTNEQPWGTAVDAVIGVQIAISLIPPAAVIGIGCALGMPMVSLNAFLLLLLNVVSLDIIGSVTILAINGVRLKYLWLEQDIRKVSFDVASADPGFVFRGSKVDVTLTQGEGALVDMRYMCQVGHVVPDDLGDRIQSLVMQSTGCRAEINVQIHHCIVACNG